MRTEASSNKINTTNNHIISNKLFIFCATFTIIIFILNFSIIHVHVTMIITLLAITELSTVKSGSDTTVFIYLFIHLFIYLFIYLFALDRNTFSGCCLQNPVRCYFYSSWKHGMILSVGRRFLSAGHFTDFFSKSVFIVCTPHTLALFIAGLNVLKNHRSGGSRFPFKNGGRGIRNRGGCLYLGEVKHWLY